MANIHKHRETVVQRKDIGIIRYMIYREKERDKELNDASYVSNVTLS